MSDEKIRVHRIVDTVKTFGQQEEYIKFSMNFVKFFKRNFKTIPKNIDAEQLAKKYHLRGFAFGNYVTQEERFFYLFKVEKQLEILAKIKGDNNLGLGALTIAIGSEGQAGSLAHFNARKLLINLNRGRKETYIDAFQGESSLIHEYAHFIDFIIGRSKESLKVNFASAVRSKTKFKDIEKIRKPVELLLNNREYTKHLITRPNNQYLMAPWEVWARLFEKTVFSLTKEYSEFSSYYQYLNKVFGNYSSEIYPSQDLIEQESTIIDVGLAIRSIKPGMIKKLGYDFVANNQFSNK